MPLIIFLFVIIIFCYIYHLRFQNKRLNNQNKQLINTNHLFEEEKTSLKNLFKEKEIQQQQLLNDSNMDLKKNISDKTRIENENVILKEEIKRIKNELEQLNKKNSQFIFFNEKLKHALDEANIMLIQKNKTFPAPGWDNEEDRLSYSELTKEDRINVYKNK